MDFKFDFEKLKLELMDLKNVTTAQVAARAAYEKAILDSSNTATANAKKLADLQDTIQADQKKADDALQVATVASKVADTLVLKQVDYLLNLLQPDTKPDPGEDPTPDIAPPVPDPLPPPESN